MMNMKIKLLKLLPHLLAADEFKVQPNNPAATKDRLPCFPSLGTHPEQWLHLPVHGPSNQVCPAG